LLKRKEMGVEQITNQINQHLDNINKVATKNISVPAILLLCAAMNKPGLSTLKSTTNICVALENLGIPTGDNPDGSPNLIVKAVNAIVDEIYRAIKEDASVKTAIQSGAVNIVGVNGAGTNPLPFGSEGTIV
jgi:hypothetical protein